MPLPIEHFIGAAKDNAWIREFIAEWRSDRSNGGGDSAVRQKLWRQAKESPDAALALFVSLAEQSSDEEERVAIAEELEWLLESHGAAYWDTMNELCTRVPEFRSVMACVWGASLPKDLKRKVEMWRS
jgi:hypothetical protein